MKLGADIAQTERKAQVQTRGQDKLMQTATSDRVLRDMIAKRDDSTRNYIANMDNQLGRKELARKKRETAILAEKHNLSKWQLEKAWVLRDRLMKMGPDNVLMLAITDFLKSKGRWNPGKNNPSMDDLAFIIGALSVKDSRIFKESQGLGEILNQLGLGKYSK